MIVYLDAVHHSADLSRFSIAGWIEGKDISASGKSVEKSISNAHVNNWMMRISSEEVIKIFIDFSKRILISVNELRF